MVRIPFIKIPGVRVGSIDPTLDIGTGGAIPTSPEPSPEPVFLTNWKIVGNSEVHGQEIWSCGEYNPTDGKYHILVQPLGCSVADIALTEPLRMINDVADKIEFPSDTEGKALVTRPFASILIGNAYISSGNTNRTDVKRKQFNDITAKPATSGNIGDANILCCAFEVKSANQTYTRNKGISVDASGRIQIYDPDYNTASDIDNFKAAYADTEVIYELTTPTTELVDAPQIEEADSYSCVISQGAKAVEWSSFETE